MPPSFVEALDKPGGAAAQSDPEPAADEMVIYPSWAPHGISPTPSTAPAKKRAGRPRVRDEDYMAVRSAARDLMMTQARGGQYLPGREVAKRLAGTEVAAGMTAESIHRRLKRHLPTTAAKATAAKAQHRPARKAAAK